MGKTIGEGLLDLAKGGYLRKKEKLKTLEDWAPKEFLNGEYDDTRAFKFRKVLVTKEHDGTVDAWIGTHKYVYNWVELENGYAVGWNENPSRGWAFLVVKIKKIS